MPKAHDSIVDQMSKGLNQALGDHPELTGTLQRSNEARRVIIKRTSNDDVPLHIFDGSNQLPSAMATVPDLSTHGPRPRVADFQATLIKYRVGNKSSGCRQHELGLILHHLGRLFQGSSDE
ncbi:hypothetical protein ACKVWC_010662 [Pyricularia oryzae]